MSDAVIHCSLTFFPQPDATATIFKAERKILSEYFFEKMFQIGVEKKNFETVVVLQEGTQHVALVPRAALIDPVLGVLEGVKDVVKMDQNPFLQPRQDLEENPIYVAAGFRDVGRVNHEQIVFIQLVKKMEVDILQFILTDFNFILIPWF